MQLETPSVNPAGPDAFTHSADIYQMLGMYRTVPHAQEEPGKAAYWRSPDVTSLSSFTCLLDSYGLKGLQ